MRISFDEYQVNQVFSQIKFITKSKIRKTLNESALVVKNNLKKELRKAKKGAIKDYQAKRRRYPTSPLRRSKAGESLARDTGNSEKKIKSNITGSVIDIGFLKFGNEFNYMKYWEFDVSEGRKRPTMLITKNKSLAKINSIFRKNLK